MAAILSRSFLRSTLLVIALTISCGASAKQGEDALIRQMLTAQVAEWNKGNISGYLHGYWESDSLVFIGKNGPTYGYNATLERYKKAYPDAEHMGQLTSTVLRIRQLDKEWAYVTGKWELKRKAGDLSGYYTLLLRKLKGQWVIVEDHSS